jgi:hypothetical protein
VCVPARRYYVRITSRAELMRSSRNARRVLYFLFVYNCYCFSPYTCSQSRPWTFIPLSQLLPTSWPQQLPSASYHRIPTRGTRKLARYVLTGRDRLLIQARCEAHNITVGIKRAFLDHAVSCGRRVCVTAVIACDDNVTRFWFTFFFFLRRSRPRQNHLVRRVNRL